MLPLHQTPILATPTGLEPVTSGVTGRRSTLLNYGAILVPSMGLEPIRDCSHQPLKLACLTAFITCPMGFYRIDHTGSHPWQSSQIRQERSSIVYVFSFRCSGLSEIPARILSYSVRPIRFLRTEFFVLISVYFLRFLSKIFLAQISPFLHGDAGGD